MAGQKADANSFASLSMIINSVNTCQSMSWWFTVVIHDRIRMIPLPKGADQVRTRSRKHGLIALSALFHFGSAMITHPMLELGQDKALNLIYDIATYPQGYVEDALRQATEEGLGWIKVPRNREEGRKLKKEIGIPTKLTKEKVHKSMIRDLAKRIIGDFWSEYGMNFHIRSIWRGKAGPYSIGTGRAILKRKQSEMSRTWPFPSSCAALGSLLL
ncbi:unnamed protein product [Dovyalis caffra]|uniref:Uncharacterized protein n=1 Tax=Dovyalis caffra TaxID=77055 RepID=A0AAV1QZE8_9ROSI|nr:unnamed protein product [Dovyalis caffra]